MKRTKKLTTCALLIATSIILALISKLIPSPFLQGGSVTFASAVPIIMASILFGLKWGLATSVSYAFLQLISGFYPPPTQNLLSFFLVVMLDYIIAFGVYGIACLFYKKDKPVTISLCGFIVTTLRFICHILSGVLIWGVYAEEGQSVFSYSLIYNGSYMVPEIIITTVTLWILTKFITNLSHKGI